MSNWTLLNAQGAAQTKPNFPLIRPIQPEELSNLQVIGSSGNVPAGAPLTPPTSATFMLTGVGTSGACSASVQVVSSLDGTNYAAACPLQTVTWTGATAGNLQFGVQSRAPYWGAYVTSISGTGAQVTCTMSC